MNAHLAFLSNEIRLLILDVIVVLENQLKTAFSMSEITIFVMVIIASKARFALSPSELVVNSRAALE